MEQKDYKYISVAYKLYDITDNKQELIEETAKDKPFVFLSGFGTTLEDFESNLVGLAEGADFDFVLSRQSLWRACRHTRSGTGQADIQRRRQV